MDKKRTKLPYSLLKPTLWVMIIILCWKNCNCVNQSLYCHQTCARLTHSHTIRYENPHTKAGKFHYCFMTANPFHLPPPYRSRLKHLVQNKKRVNYLHFRQLTLFSAERQGNEPASYMFANQKIKLYYLSVSPKCHQSGLVCRRFKDGWKPKRALSFLSSKLQIFGDTTKNEPNKLWK